MSSARSAQLGNVRTPRPIQVSSAGFDYAPPSISEGHKSFVRTLFLMLLGSKKSTLSQDTIHIHVEDNRYQAELVQVSSARLDLTTFDLLLW